MGHGNMQFTNQLTNAMAHPSTTSYLASEMRPTQATDWGSATAQPHMSECHSVESCDGRENWSSNGVWWDFMGFKAILIGIELVLVGF